MKFPNSRKTVRLTSSAVVAVVAGTFVSPVVYAEGSYQMGIGQHMRDYSNTQSQDGTDDVATPLYVDILSAGEVINISLCGANNGDNLSVEIFAPSDYSTSVYSQTLSSSNVDCADPLTAPLTNPLRYETTETGAYRVKLENTSGTLLNRVDVSVTPDSATNPDPTVAAGRLWGYNFSFLTGSFSEASSTDADYYALIPGGRPDTNYIWQLDLNNFAGNGYNLMANSVGVDAPRSGYSTPQSGNSVTYEHPLYLGVPAVASDRPLSEPAITGFHFLDDQNLDNSITPNATPGEQDAGSFRFNTDVEGTYQIAIDLNMDGEYGNTGDALLVGQAVPGDNEVLWDGDDAGGAAAPLGEYDVQLRINTGEFHFVAADVETSGGNDVGLTIYAADKTGALSDTLVYWDDETLIGGTTTTPNGALSSSTEGKHTWGSFSSSGFGNGRLIDTYTYGLSNTSVASVVITDVDELPDMDADGIDDSIDLDNDNDGILDVIEGAAAAIDTDNDGVPDFLDTDSDNDGIPDSVEERNQPVVSSVDSDGDRIADEVDVDATGGADTNGNGIDDRYEVTDSDGDGIPDHRDLDSDADNIDDAVEAGQRPAQPVDSDTDNAPDYIDTDSDDDSIADAVEGTVDTDADGTADYRDLDSDDDGIADAVELSVDTDADGAADFRDEDSDADGIPDSVEGETDSDGDSQPDYLDLDSDNDSIADELEGVVDTDTDGTPNYRDTDSDDDGVNDADETNADTDGDGISDAIDTDSDGDGIADDVEGRGDFDADGIENRLDTDSDNDGISDATESAKDTDGDSHPNYLDLDSDNDGVPDSAETYLVSGLIDTDSDGLLNFLDRDSDNDGLTDTREAGGSDLDGDGIVDNYADANADGLDDSAAQTPLALPDFDGDLVRDILDRDSDNDGISDALESAGAGADEDNNGTLDAFTDENSDGLHDSAGAVPSARDTDGDGSPDHLDLDSDGDFRYDLWESGGEDIDRNGVVDDFSDDNGNGIPDTVDASLGGRADHDADGIANFADADFVEDADSDNDGIVDAFDPDALGDGFGDIAQQRFGGELPVAAVIPDTNGNGVPNRLEVNSGVRTGLNGGCTLVRSGGPQDPTLPLVGLLAMLAIAARRRSTRQ